MRGNRWLKFFDRYWGVMLCWLLGLSVKPVKSSSAEKEFKNILLLKLSALGDTILLSPTLRAIRKKYPQAKISIVVTSINKAAVENCPYLDEIIICDYTSFFAKPWRVISFLKNLRKKDIELFIDFDQWLRISPLIGFFSGAKERIGFFTVKQFRHYLYTGYVRHQRQRHEVECFLDIVKLIGIHTAEKKLEVWPNSLAQPEVENFFKKNNIAQSLPLVIIHPGCGKHGYPRQWKAENYAQLADRLIAVFSGNLFFTGSRSEKNLVNEIKGKMINRPFDVAGVFTFSELCFLIKKSVLLICGNTGIMHLAAALSVPTVALHGPTDPCKWGPWGEGHKIVRKELECSPCLYLGHEYQCDTHRCMDLISVEEVFVAVSEMMGEIKATITT